MSEVDVVIPCYKYGHFLKECVESVLTQSVADLRILIIDDASPDQTAEVAADLVAQDARVLFVRHSTNHGHIATYNEGLDWAEGHYTVLLSADDLLTPGSLARAVKVMNDHPEVGLVYGRGIPFQSDGPLPEPRAIAASCEWKVLTGTEFLELCCAGADNPVYAPTALVRTRLQKELGGYRQDLPHAGDMEMWVRFAARAKVAVLETEQAWYRLHASNMGSDWHNQPLAELRQREAAFDRIFASYAPWFEDTDRLRSLADRALARQSFWEAAKAFDRGDLASCEELLAYTLARDTGFRQEPAWARLSWKRRLGPKLWSALLPVIRLTRQARAIRFSQTGYQVYTHKYQET